MDRQFFATKVLKCSRSLWDKVLTGKRNLSLTKARRAAMIFDSDVTVWMDPDLTQKRRSAWKEFSGKEGAAK